jgi:hypothetical protein
LLQSPMASPLPLADEVGLMGTLHVISTAQVVYSGDCGGYYAPTLTILARPEPGKHPGLVSADLATAKGATAVEKYGYRIEMIAPPSPKSVSCHGVPAGGSAETFSVVARPLNTSWLKNGPVAPSDKS